MQRGFGIQGAGKNQAGQPAGAIVGDQQLPMAALIARRGAPQADRNTRRSDAQRVGPVARGVGRAPPAAAQLPQADKCRVRRAQSPGIHRHYGNAGLAQALQHRRPDLHLGTRRIDQQQHLQRRLLLPRLQQRIHQTRGDRRRRAQPGGAGAGGRQIPEQPGIQHQQVARLRDHAQQFTIDLALVLRRTGGIGRGEVAQKPQITGGHAVPAAGDMHARGQAFLR
jgi:hypothetical protein